MRNYFLLEMAVKIWLKIIKFNINRLAEYCLFYTFAVDKTVHSRRIMAEKRLLPAKFFLRRPDLFRLGVYRLRSTLKPAVSQGLLGDTVYRVLESTENIEIK